MATIDDIGVPGQPLSTPPLTAWQAAVRDHLHQEDWVSWTPTVGGATYSTLSANYCKRGQTVVLVVKAVVATVTGDISFSLPVTAHADQVGGGVGTVRAVAGASAYHMHAYLSGGTTLTVRVAGTSGASTTIGPAVPATWTAGNQIGFTATYRAATALAGDPTAEWLKEQIVEWLAMNGVVLNPQAVEDLDKDELLDIVRDLED